MSGRRRLEKMFTLLLVSVAVVVGPWVGGGATVAGASGQGVASAGGTVRVDTPHHDRGNKDRAFRRIIFAAL